MPAVIEKGHGGTAKRWRWVKPLLTVIGLVGALIVVVSAWDGEAIAAWKRDASPLRYFAAMAILPALGVPFSPLFILAGATFGNQIGLLGSGLALGVNLALCYWIARRMRRRLEPLLRRFGYELRDLDAKERGSFRFTLAMKLMPGLPTFLKSYALGMAGVPFGVYFAVSMFFSGVYGFLLVTIGESLLEHRFNMSTLLVAIGAALVLILLWWWRRRTRDEGRREHDHQAAPGRRPLHA